MKTDTVRRSIVMRLFLCAPFVLPGLATHAQTLSDWKIHPAGTQIAVDTFPMSNTVTPDGKYMLVLTAGLHPPGIGVIDLATGKELSRTPVSDAWLGLTMSKSGDKVYVGGGARAAVFEFSFANGLLTAGRTFPLVAEKDRTPQDFAGDVRLAPDGHLLYVANLYRDSVVVMNPQSGFILSRIKTGRRPYRILFHPSGKTMYVTSWAEGTIGQYDVSSGERLSNVRVAPHPTDMLWVDGGLPAGAGAGGDGQAEIKARMFVPGANTNSLYVLGASETGDLTKLETINLSLTPQQPLGMTPGALGLSEDKKRVYVACSDVNAVAVVDIVGERNLVKGFIPTGAYPTAVTGLPGGRIAILNGHGNSVQLVDEQDDAQLDKDTDEVMANSPYRDNMPDGTDAPQGSPLRAGGAIKHVVYVVREGSAGSASPNRDRLAGEFVSLNFDSTAETNAEGVNRAVAGIAPDYTVRLAPASAAGRRRAYDFEGQDPANLPPVGYLWNAMSQAGLKLRNYGFQVHNRDKPTADGEQVDRVYDPTLAASTDMEYRGTDQAYPDTERAKEFANEVGEYGQLGEMPPLLLVRIGNDDQALGMLADAVTKSRFWNETAMFVVDAVAAPDKPAALVISPWTKRGATDAPVNNQVNNHVYDQMSVLRTVELILGLRPMTTFDAAATPLFGVFANTPGR
jgi:YVTN family beta-propeller protein